MSRVMLINPPWYRLQGANFDEIPLGLSYLAGYIKKKGHVVKVYNADFSKRKNFSHKVMYDGFLAYKRILGDLEDPLWQDVVSKIMNFRPEIVGIGMKTGAYKSGVNIATLVKKACPSIITIAGGVHPTLLPKEVASLDCFDFVVKGEGEVTFHELLHAINNKQRIEGVKGVAFSSGDGIIETEDREFISDLDTIPFPERDDIVGREEYSPEALAIMMTARGCPHRCTFCASERIWKRKVRFRSPDNVIEEMTLLKKKYGIKHLKIRDDLFTMNKKRVLEICDRMIFEKLNFTWQCEVRADSLDEDIVRKMRDAGCIGSSIGIESGSDKVLARIRKGETVDQIKNAIRILKKYGINVGAFIMIGFPDETEEEMDRTMDLVKEVQPDNVILSIVTPYPGTELYDQALAGGLIAGGLAWEEYFHQSPKMGLAKDKKEFTRIAGKFMNDVEKYNNSFMRKIKKKTVQIFRNPKALYNTLAGIIKRITG